MLNTVSLQTTVMMKIMVNNEHDEGKGIDHSDNDDDDIMAYDSLPPLSINWPAASAHIEGVPSV